MYVKDIIIAFLSVGLIRELDLVDFVGWFLAYGLRLD